MKDKVLQTWVLQIITLKNYLKYSYHKHEVIAIIFLNIYFMPDSLLSDSQGTSFIILVFTMWTIVKVFIEFVTKLLLFSVLVFWLKACGISAPRPGMELTPSALEDEIVTSGPPGRFPHGISSGVHL